MCNGHTIVLNSTVKCDDGHTIALYSTLKRNGVTMYHLSVGICVMSIKKIKKKILGESLKNMNKKKLPSTFFFFFKT